MKKKLYIVVFVLVCLFGSSCGNADHAISFSVGEKLEESENDVVSVEVQETGVADIPKLQENAQEICVYVCGAVNSPGVVVLPRGSRCNDALESAGGFTEDAAKEAVNLAKPLTDGEQIYFPTQEEYKAKREMAENTQAQLVNINVAEAALLCTLPGIGESKAKAIIAYREKNGRFVVKEDVMQVPGIKESAYSQICDLITVD